jgi:nanoRNase/pAp phosphatase (c-di-AMP/oligoRNAs hydrolase)
MQPTDEQAALLRAFQAPSFLIILRSQPSFDQTASALALHLALQSVKKQSHLACEQPLPSHLKVLMGSEQVRQQVGNHSLQVTFDYSENMVENVSYNIDQQNKKFHLIVKPKKGHPGLDPTTVEYSQVGIDADSIFMFGVSAYDQIQPFYEREEVAFTQAQTIAINRSITTFAETNVDVSGYTSHSEWMMELLKLWQLPLTSDVATNILAGIESTTDSFRHASVTAETFETVAHLMRNGAKRLQLSNNQNSSNSSLAQAFAQKASAQAAPVPPKPGIQVPSQWSPPAR